MRAIVQDRYSSDPEAVLHLADVATPTAAADHVLVEVRAASIDRGTWHIMTGLPYVVRPVLGMRGPKAPNPGRSFAGVVHAIGGNVNGFAPGDEVFGSGDGSFAEFISAPAKQVVQKPANVSFEQAAAAPISAVTALQAVRDKAHVQAAEHVLVVGASGGVGTYAVQIAKAFGAEVTGVASTSKIDLVVALGSDHVVDYTRESITDASQHYDVIIDTGGSTSVSKLRSALTRDGRLVVVGGETDGRWLGGATRLLHPPLLSLFVSQKLITLSSKENAADLSDVAALFESGQLTSAVDRTFPLGDVPEAMTYLIDGHARGKIVITV